MSLWLHNFVGMCKCLWRFQHLCNIACHKHRHSNQNFREPCNSNETCHYQPHHGLLAVSSYAHSKPYAHNNWKWTCFTSTTPHDETTNSLNTKHNLFQNASTKQTIRNMLNSMNRSQPQWQHNFGKACDSNENDPCTNRTCTAQKMAHHVKQLSFWDPLYLKDKPNQHNKNNPLLRSQICLRGRRHYWTCFYYYDLLCHHGGKQSCNECQSWCLMKNITYTTTTCTAQKRNPNIWGGSHSDTTSTCKSSSWHSYNAQHGTLPENLCDKQNHILSSAQWHTTTYSVNAQTLGCPSQPHLAICDAIHT